jgi:hypothetical protein
MLDYSDSDAPSFNGSLSRSLPLQILQIGEEKEKFPVVCLLC